MHQPALPDLLSYLWEWFPEILNGCSSSGWSAPTITWCDLEAWSRLTGNVPEPWECRALMRLAAAYARSTEKKSTA